MDQGPNGGNEISSGEKETFNERDVLEQVTDESMANIIADIVGHPNCSPTVPELKYLNPSLSERAIRHHLSDLQDLGVVRKSNYEPGKQSQDIPSEFYALTAEARKLFNQKNLFPEDAWQRQYARVEKTEQIKEIEEKPHRTD